MINVKPILGVASRPYSSVDITADKRLCFTMPKLTAATSFIRETIDEMRDTEE